MKNAVAAAQSTPSKLPVPSSEEQMKTRKKLERVYRTDDAKTRGDRLILADKLDKLAEQPGTTSVEIFVILQAATTLAASGGDLELAMSLGHKLSSTFSVDTIETDRSTISRFASDAQSKAAFDVLVPELQLLVHEAKRKERFDIAVAITEEVFQVSQKTAGSEHRKQLKTSGHKCEVNGSNSKSTKAQSKHSSKRRTIQNPICWSAVGYAGRGTNGIQVCPCWRLEVIWRLRKWQVRTLQDR